VARDELCLRNNLRKSETRSGIRGHMEVLRWHGLKPLNYPLSPYDLRSSKVTMWMKLKEPTVTASKVKQAQ
jgi:hypothetical protein